MLNAAITIPDLPPGWTGTPNDLLEHIRQNGTVKLSSGDYTVVIGGSEPTSNLGIWVNEGEIWIYDSDLGKYTPAHSVPVGAIIPWPTNNTVPPTHYLICDGRTLVRADYPELFSRIGTQWNLAADGSTEFRLPNIKSRTIVGSGTGEYDPKDPTKGKLPPYVTGTYEGYQFPGNLPTQDNPSVNKNIFIGSTGIKKNDGPVVGSVVQPSTVMQFIIRYK